MSHPEGRGIPMHEKYKGSVEVDVLEVKQLENLIRKETRVRMMAFPADSNKNYPIRFSEIKSWPNGRRQESSITGQAEDSTFRLGDTITIQIAEYPVWPKGLARKNLIFKAGLGKDPVKQQDNELFSFKTTKETESGDLEKLSFSVVPDEPLKEGQVPESGVLKLKAQYRDGTQASITGEISPGRVKVTFQTRDDKKGTAVLNLDGDVIK
jgi:hypothetical protein